MSVVSLRYNWKNRESNLRLTACVKPITLLYNQIPYFQRFGLFFLMLFLFLEAGARQLGEFLRKI